MERVEPPVAVAVVPERFPPDWRVLVAGAP
jgi:hypothetical protein